MGYTLLDDTGKPAKGTYTLLPDDPQQPIPAAPAKPLAWSDVPAKALKSIPASAGRFVSDIAQAVRHPLDTAGNLIDVAEGGIRKLLPEGGARADAFFNANPANPFRQAPAQQQAQRTQQTAKADAVGQFFKERYGSAEGMKNTLATDPIGALSDASTVFTGGAALASKVPGMAGVAGKVGMVGNALNPATLAAKGVAKAAPVLGTAAANLIGNLGTHTGAESISQAFKAGRNGGAQAKTLADNMRGNVPMTDVLDAAKANLEQMGRDKSAAYRQGMAQVSGDQTVLDFAGIDQAVADAANVATFKGQVKNARAAQTQQAIAKAVEEWKALDPGEYHTPEGLDALKQKIGGIVESIPFEEKTAGLVGKKIYNAIKAEITRQAPVYADTMKGYTEASEQIREIERALSLGSKASVDTAMRKLQSLTRNNVNTNYGNRLDLARQLETQGGREIIPALSGQALSSWTPRGLGGAVAGGLGLGGYALGGPQLAIPALAVQSPRLMGEMALAAGKGARVAGNAAAPLNALAASGVSPTILANFLAQGGKLSDAAENTPQNALAQPRTR